MTGAHADIDGNKGRRRELAVLLALLALGAMPYVFGLGFYSDDFAFRQVLDTHRGASVAQLYAALAEAPNLAVRPLQIGWYILFEKLAPGSATAPHLANHLLFAAGVLTLHAALRALRVLRGSAFAIAALYACLPHFSVAKMWYANHQAIIAFALFSGALWATTRLSRATSPGRIAAWSFLAALFSGAGNLAYELFSFSALLLPAFVLLAQGERVAQVWRDPRLWTASFAILAAFVATTAYKLSFAYGFDVPATSGGTLARLGEIAWLYLRAGFTSFGTLGLWLPVTAARIALGPYAAPVAFLAALAVAGIVFLARHGSSAGSGSGKHAIILLALAGAVFFVAGYVAFWPNINYASGPWGEQNRGNIGGAFGVALMVQAGLLAVSRWSAIAARWALATICALGVFVQLCVGMTWADAARAQVQVESIASRALVPRLRDGDAFLLHGGCPYVGSGPVYPYGWDLAAKIMGETGLTRLQGEYTRPGMTFGEQGISVPVNPWAMSFVPYAQAHVLDLDRGDVMRVRSVAEARRYFAQRPFARNSDCEYELETGIPMF